MVYQREINVQIGGHEEMHDLTDEEARIVSESKVRHGFAPCSRRLRAGASLPKFAARMTFRAHEIVSNYYWRDNQMGSKFLRCRKP